MAITIAEIRLGSSDLDQVVLLGTANARTLGFLPAAAFENHASQGWIIGAFDQPGEVVGYALYRVARGRAALAHLCVADTARGQGVARQLFDSLTDRTHHLRGIVVHCRRDYELHGLWQKLGFVPIRELLGRGSPPSILTEWWYRHEHQDLFTAAATFAGELPPTEVGADLNVIYDIEENRPNSEDSQALVADWLSPQIQLCVTPEALVEVNRISSQSERATQRVWLGRYGQITGSHHSIEFMLTELTRVLGSPGSDQTFSDYRHLAHVAAADAPYFVTKDEPLLKNSATILDSIGVRVLTPSQLLLEFDEVRNQAAYAPTRLLGSSLVVQRISAEDREEVLSRLVAHASGERRQNLRETLDRLLVGRGTTVSGVRVNDAIAGVVGIDEADEKRMRVPLLRTTPGPLASTVARGLVALLLDRFLRSRATTLEIDESSAGAAVLDTLAEAGFVSDGATWVRMTTREVVDIERLAATMAGFSKAYGDSSLLANLADSLGEALREPMDAGAASLVERRLWPSKLLGVGIPSVVVPIRPEWAQELFDPYLAAQQMLELSDQLLLGWENAYYRSPSAVSGLAAGSRLLWYVTRGGGQYEGTGAIRACSAIRDVYVGPARGAFKKYRRLGVYEWNHVMSITHNKPDGRVMVINFDQTERLPNPIEMLRMMEIVNQHEHRSPSLQGPFAIAEATFSAIYEEATRHRG